MAEILLQFQYSALPPNQMDETLLIDTAGEVWLWILAGATTERRQRCGTFKLDADPARATQAKELADQLAALPAVEETIVRGNAALAIEASGKHHTLAAFSSPERNPVLNQAVQFITTLYNEILAQPVSAIEIALNIQGKTVVFELLNKGKQSCKVLFDQKSFALFGFNQAGETFTWHALEDETIGLMEAESLELLDGILLPAEIPPQSRSILTFGDALIADPGQYTLTGSLSGTLILLRPNEAPALMPNRRFYLTTPQIPWQASE